MSTVYDIVIIGGGPAGLTAAVYASRAGKAVIVLEKNSFGGQITWSPKVENFPSYISLSGIELGDKMMEQAMEQGAELELEEVLSVSRDGATFTVQCESGEEYTGRSLIIATGAKPRMMGLEKEEELVGNGVCFCAVCDGAFYKDKTVAVYGGGNSALQDALLLSEKCSMVYLIHRRSEFKGEKRLVELLEKKDNVELVLNSTVTGLLGDGELSGIEINREGKPETLQLEGIFVAIGHSPDLSAFINLTELNGQGYAQSDEACLTGTPGVFVAGDCRSKAVRQLTTAVADGSVAALAACAYLDSQN